MLEGEGDGRIAVVDEAGTGEEAVALAHEVHPDVVLVDARLPGLDCVEVITRISEAGVAVIDAPVLATGRLELRWYLREQTIARVVHRYGNVMEPAAAE